jgi:predicted XRE-type DNA-binding protein
LTTFSELWAKFKRSKRYREEFVAQHSRQAIPFQIAALMKQHGMTQEEVAKSGGLHQSSVSRAIDPSYGKMSLDTLVRIAAGFDVAFIGHFVPFSELPKWFDQLSEDEFKVATFDQEDAELETTQHELMELAAKDEDSRKVRYMDEFLLSQLKGGQRAGPQPAKKPKDQQHGISFVTPSNSDFLRPSGANQSLSEGQRS